jgi:hypothetical protein
VDGKARRDEKCSNGQKAGSGCVRLVEVGRRQASRKSEGHARIQYVDCVVTKVVSCFR